jgi:hypothetical protein
VATILVILSSPQRESASRFLQLLQGRGPRRSKGHQLDFVSGYQPVRCCGWEDLILSGSVAHLVQKDFEALFQRKQWLRNRKLPFRHGYEAMRRRTPASFIERMNFIVSAEHTQFP